MGRSAETVTPTGKPVGVTDEIALRSSFAPKIYSRLARIFTKTVGDGIDIAGVEMKNLVGREDLGSSPRRRACGNRAGPKWDTSQDQRTGRWSMQWPAYNQAARRTTFG